MSLANQLNMDMFVPAPVFAAIGVRLTSAAIHHPSPK
jgi:hypothetical protein